METLSTPIPLGSRLKQVREGVPLSQREAAREIGCSMRALQEIESGRTLQPHPKTVRAINNFCARYEEGRP